MPWQSILMGTFTAITTPPTPTSQSYPSGALTVLSASRTFSFFFWFGWGSKAGVSMPPAMPPSTPPQPSLRGLFMPPTNPRVYPPLPHTTQAPPWGRWQPSTVKGWGSHDGFHRWSVEIAGKDPRLCGATKSPRVGERNMGGKEGDSRDKDLVTRRGESKGREGGACLRRVVRQSS